jgi:hypothetical protein
MDTMVNNDIIDQASAQEKLKDIRTLLKRADRIIWWLRWWRIKVTGEVIESKIEEIERNYEFDERNNLLGTEESVFNSSEEAKQKITELENLFKKITKKDYDYYVKNSITINDFNSAFNLLALKNHWSTMFEQSPQVNQVEWSADLLPSELFQRLERAENEWKQKQEEELEMEPDDQIVIDYGKYAWVKLDREYCELEGRAMGHCGNTGTPQAGDRILSFRTKVDGGKQRPHLTFILDKNGLLGEMKGRGNDKPSEKYHPYIIDLLKQDFVKGIKGGGYMPENNFDLSDLDEQTREQLMDQKPELGSSYDMLKAGKTEGFHEKLESELDALDIPYREIDTQNNEILFDEESDPSDLYGVRELDSKESKVLIQKVSGLLSGETDMMEIYDYPRAVVYDQLENVADDLYEQLSDEEKQSLKEYVEENYEDVDFDDISIEEVINQVPEIESAFIRAVHTGLEYGDEFEIIGSFEEWLKDSGIKRDPLTGDYKLIASSEDVSQALHRFKIEGDLYFFGFDTLIAKLFDIKDFREPRNGWHGDFDMNAAGDRLADELSSEGVI